MTSKAPQFEKTLDKYFSTLELDEKGGQWRTCHFSGEKFYIRPEDIEFYKRIRVPLPTLSPRERIRRKLAFMNSYNLFEVKSAYSGKTVIAQFPPGTPYRVYEHQVWFGEKWDPLAYARRYDLERGFFDQFRELQLEVPRPSLNVDNTSVGSDYTNNSSWLKNCYLVFDSLRAEDSAYSIALFHSRNCYDCFTAFNSDTCYECLESTNLFRCFFVEYSHNCLDSYFLYDCRDCQYCFGGVNLRHKKYYFFGEPLTRDEYEKRMQEMNLGNREVLKSFKEMFSEFKKRAIYKETHNDRAVSSVGDYIKNSKNCYSCFYMVDSENLTYSVGGVKNRDAYDIIGGSGTEFSYDANGGIQNYGIKFSTGSDFSRELEYCDYCINCHDCLGCVGLKNKSFCIFNKQYAEGIYWDLVDQIKTNMLKAGEYGEFFPPELAPIPYNVSIATSYKGYDDVEVAKRYGYRGERLPEVLPKAEGEIVNADDLPKDIKEVKDDILDKIIFDQKNNKKFRYTREELEFYLRYNLPLPTEHYSIRLARSGSVLVLSHSNSTRGLAPSAGGRCAPPTLLTVRKSSTARRAINAKLPEP